MDEDEDDPVYGLGVRLQRLSSIDDDDDDSSDDDSSDEDDEEEEEDDDDEDENQQQQPTALSRLLSVYDDKTPQQQQRIATLISRQLSNFLPPTHDDDTDDDDDEEEEEEEDQQQHGNAKERANLELLKKEAEERCEQGLQMLDNDCLSIVLTKFSNVLDVHKWKSVSKKFNALCTKSIENKCPDKKKRMKFESEQERVDIVLLHYCIKHGQGYSYFFPKEQIPRMITGPYGSQRMFPTGNDRKPSPSRRRHDAEYIATTYGWFDYSLYFVHQVTPKTGLQEFWWKIFGPTPTPIVNQN